jgi:methyltransferase family protein
MILILIHFTGIGSPAFIEPQRRKWKNPCDAPRIAVFASLPTTAVMNKYPETFMSLGALGSTFPVYRPTFDFPGPYIDGTHRAFSTCPVKRGHRIQIKNGPRGRVIGGWLRREDALKLYEIAYHVAGDILEIGSHLGLSTCILSEAIRNSPRRKTLYSVELDAGHSVRTELNLRKRGAFENVKLICGDALSVVPKMSARGKKFGFVFVDHSHTYEATYKVCVQLGKLVSRGGFCLFHDFNDSRNNDESSEEYDVYRAVIDALPPRQFEFYGIFGCAALYRRK